MPATASAPALNDYDERVAENLRGYLAQKRIAKHDLALRIGRTDFWVGRRTNGHTALSVGELALIAGALGEPMSRFLPTEVSMPADTLLAAGARSSTDRASDYGSQSGRFCSPFRRPSRRRRDDFRPDVIHLRAVS